DVQTMRASVRHGHDSTDANRIARLHDDDLRWIGDVDMKRVADRIVDGPARAAGNADIRDALAGADIDDRDGDRAGDGGIAAMRDQESCAPGIVRQSVRPSPDRDLFDARNFSGREKPYRVLTTVRREHEIGLGDERPRDSGQVRYGPYVSLSRDVDDIDGVVTGMGDVDAPRRLVHCCMIESAGLRVRGQADEAEMPQRHVSARQPAQPRGARRWPRCDHARLRSPRLRRGLPLIDALPLTWRDVAAEAHDAGGALEIVERHGAGTGGRWRESVAGRTNAGS